MYYKKHQNLNFCLAAAAILLLRILCPKRSIDLIKDRSLLETHFSRSRQRRESFPAPTPKPKRRSIPEKGGWSAREASKSS